MHIHCFLLCVLNIQDPIQYLTIYHILVFVMVEIISKQEPDFPGWLLSRSCDFPVFNQKAEDDAPAFSIPMPVGSVKHNSSIIPNADLSASPALIDCILP